MAGRICGPHTPSWKAATITADILDLPECSKLTQPTRPIVQRRRENKRHATGQTCKEKEETQNRAIKTRNKSKSEPHDLKRAWLSHLRLRGLLKLSLNVCDQRSENKHHACPLRLVVRTLSILGPTSANLGSTSPFSSLP